MKKKNIFAILAVCLVLLPMAFLMSACSGEKYTISFMVQGQVYSTFQTSGHEIVPLPETDPSAEGYTFGGWFLDDICNNKFYNEVYLNRSISEDMTIYAKMTANPYTMLFTSNGGSYVSPITKGYQSEVTAPLAPTKGGYVFAGWFTDNNTFENEYTFLTMPLGGITLYAKWVEAYTLEGTTITGLTQAGQASNIIAIASDVEAIGSDALGQATFDTVVIDSATIASSLIEKTSHGKLLLNATTIYVKTSLAVEGSTYLLENYTKLDSSNKNGYYKYELNIAQ